MNTKSRKLVLVGGLLTITGVSLIFLLNQVIIPQILIVVGIELIIFVVIREFFLRKQSLKFLGYAILGFSLLNFLRHSSFFLLLADIAKVFENDPGLIWYLVRETIWLVISIWLVFTGIKLLRNHWDIPFHQYINSIELKRLSVIIILFLILEIPIFYIHGDFFGRLHGHGFWEIGTHVH